MNYPNNLKKGILYGSMGVIAESFLPIVTNSRPLILDPVFFAWFTLIFEALIFLPILFIERKLHHNKLKAQQVFSKSQIDHLQLASSSSSLSPLNSPKSNSANLICSIPAHPPSKLKIIGVNMLIGIIFAFALIVHYMALPSSGAILGSIVLKSSILYSTLIGWLFLKERVDRSQIFFTSILLIGVVFALTEGFSLEVPINIGGLLLLTVPLLWMIGHYFTKILLRFEIGQPFEIVFWRVSVGALLIGIYYWIFFPIQNLRLCLEWQYLQFLLLGGITFSIIHICWYKVIQYMDLSKSTVIYALTPIVTSLFASLLLNEKFTYYYVVGMILVIFSIFMIYRKKQ